MTDARPLLAFGPPTTGQIPSAGPRPVPRPRGPGPQRQGERLTPQFAALRDALAAGRVATSASTDEQDPELVVVFDLAGTEVGWNPTCAYNLPTPRERLFRPRRPGVGPTEREVRKPHPGTPGVGEATTIVGALTGGSLRLTAGVCAPRTGCPGSAGRTAPAPA